MSGNPFRASLLQKPTSVAPATHNFINHADSHESGLGELDTSDSVVNATPLPAKTKKSVRIESPAASPPHPVFHDADDDALQHPINQRTLAAPLPLTSPASFSDNFEAYAADGTFGKSTGRRDDAYEARDVTGSLRRSSDMVDAAMSPSGAPVNPFSRTLATIEPQEKGSGEFGKTAGQNRDRTTADKTVPGTTRPSLDVEGFKNLLMTGISSPSSSGQPSQTAPAVAPNLINASVFESSSSTDTSSISRQSIFEPVQEPHIETPRTSYDMAASDNEDRVGLIGELKKAEKKQKPPPPKHRHGKQIASRIPQVVSFSDFSVNEPTSSPISRNRTDSDLNKPLPAPPILSPTAHMFSQDKTQDEPPPLETRASGSSGQSETPPQKKVPPPVPIARRQSQLRSSTIGNRSRSNSSLTMSSQHSADLSVMSLPIMSSEPMSSPAAQKAPPPPPPTRRHGAALVGSNSNTPSANSSSTELPSTTSLRRTPVSLPNPPTSRRPTFSSPPPSPAVTRTSSVSSHINPRSVSNESMNMAPPPPPPRRRQSGRSSLDKERPYPLPTSSPAESRRTSSENKRSSFDNYRRTSVASESSLRHEYAIKNERENEQALYSPMEEGAEDRGLGLEHSKSASSNILDDMEKFQREIDELRARYKPAG